LEGHTKEGWHLRAFKRIKEAWEDVKRGEEEEYGEKSYFNCKKQNQLDNLSSSDEMMRFLLLQFRPVIDCEVQA
jgi:hypothetical protein